MRRIEGLLIDLDGTMYEAGTPVPGAAEAVERLRRQRLPFLFTTNTSRRCRRDIAADLRAMGLRIYETEIFSAPVAAAGWLTSVGLRRVQLLVPESTHSDFADFTVTEQHPEAVLVGDMGAAFTFAVLNGAFRNLLAGARLVAIHRNRFWLPENEPSLDAGPFVAALEYATGKAATLVGKPAPAFFDAAAALLGVPRECLAVVGDDIESDVKGGRAAGLATYQVRTGKFDEAALAKAGPEERPHGVLASIADVSSIIA